MKPKSLPMFRKISIARWSSIALLLLALYFTPFTYIGIALGIAYFGLIVDVVIDNWGNKDEVSRYLNRHEMSLFIIVFGLMGFDIGLLLANKYEELFAPLITVLGLLTLQGLLGREFLADLKDEIRKFLLLVRAIMFVSGFFVLLGGLLVSGIPIMVSVARAFAIAMITVILGFSIMLTIILSFPSGSRTAVRDNVELWNYLLKSHFSVNKPELVTYRVHSTDTTKKASNDRHPSSSSDRKS